MDKLLQELAAQQMPSIRGKLKNALNQVGDGIYHYIDGEGITWTNGWGWTDGFWPGQLYLVGAYLDDRELIAAARRLIKLFENRLSHPETLDHDIGFLYSLSAVYDFKLFSDDFSMHLAILAAERLIERYHKSGKFIVAWNEWEEDTQTFREEKKGKAIIDCMMNLPLLLFAHKMTGNPYYAEVAHLHAKTTAAHFFRPDGSTYHTFNFDPKTGSPIKGVTQQGYADESCWSRGQAWAIYGFTLMYRNTGITDYADCARLALKYWLSSIPQNGIPPWDFHAPNSEQVDTSAAVIACSGIIDMIRYGLLDFDAETECRILVSRTLLTIVDQYLIPDEKLGILSGGTSDFPRKQTQASLIYGDYFYIECLLKILGWNQFCWTLE